MSHDPHLKVYEDLQRDRGPSPNDVSPRTRVLGMALGAAEALGVRAGRTPLQALGDIATGLGTTAAAIPSLLAPLPLKYRTLLVRQAISGAVETGTAAGEGDPRAQGAALVTLLGLALPFKGMKAVPRPAETTFVPSLIDAFEPTGSIPTYLRRGGEILKSPSGDPLAVRQGRSPAQKAVKLLTESLFKKPVEHTDIPISTLETLQNLATFGTKKGPFMHPERQVKPGMGKPKTKRLDILGQMLPESVSREEISPQRAREIAFLERMVNATAREKIMEETNVMEPTARIKEQTAFDILKKYKRSRQ